MNCIAYSGKVTIIPKGGTPIKGKNKGTTTLFNILCEFLGGTYIAYDSISKHLPKYISIVSKVDSKPDNYSGYTQSDRYLSNNPLIETREVDKDKNSLVLTSVLLKDHFLSLENSQKAEGAECDVLLLTSSNEILAHYSIEYSQIASVEASDGVGEALIKWELSFSNKT